MFTGSTMKKFVSILVIVMIASFAIAGMIFVGEYGENGFAALDDKIRPANAIDVDEEKTEPLVGIKSIKVKTSSDDITFIPTDSNEVKARFHGYYSANAKDYRPELTTTLTGEELTIKVEYPTFIGNISGNLKLDVYLPKAYSDSLQINTSSANVTIDELNVAGFICKTTSGDVNARLVNSDKAELGTASGKTRIAGKYGSFSFNSTSGDFNSDGITAGNAVLKTTSGKIQLNVTADDLQLHSTSGDLIADQVNAKNIKLDTASGKTLLRGIPGNVDATSASGDMNLEYTKYDNNIKIGTASGKTAIKLPQDAEFALEYKTASGTGKCDFPLAITGSQVRNNLEGTVVSGRNKITVNSASGDLNITK